MSEKNGGAWREGFILQHLIECLNGFCFCVCVNSDGFPEGDAIFRHLRCVLLTRQWKDHSYLREFLKGTYEKYGGICDWQPRKFIIPSSTLNWLLLLYLLFSKLKFWFFFALEMIFLYS